MSTNNSQFNQPEDDQSVSPSVNQQYQDILDKYAEKLAKTPTLEEPEAPAPSEPTPTAIPAPPVNPALMSANTEEEEPLVDNPVPPKDITPPPITPPVPTETPPILPEPEIPQPVPPTPQPEGNIFKILFFISLFIFLAVAAAIAYTLFIKSAPTPTPQLETVSSETKSAVCDLNDKQYQVGETFTATDGCNTCICNDDLIITCTEKSCETNVQSAPVSTKSATPTKTATSSAKTPTPTKTASASAHP